MEPRSFKRGNAHRPAETDAAHRRLQWSHVLSNVETARISESLMAGKKASMEPRSFKRGNAPSG